VCFIFGAAAVYVLRFAMRELPVATAYAVFTGIGAVGAITFGIVRFDDPVTPGRLVALGLIVARIVSARLFAAT
jgi:quaternary ammonium compound-resistance protein SugE